MYTFTLTIIDDAIYEGEEYFTLSVVDPPGLVNYSTSITIQDNEGKLHLESKSSNTMPIPARLTYRLSIPSSRIDYSTDTVTVQCTRVFQHGDN